VKDRHAANSHEIPPCEIDFSPDEKWALKSALYCNLQANLSKK
jgi:hypothetical protein